MTQHDYNIANQPMPQARQDINNALKSLVTHNAGNSEPSTTYAYMFWIDITNNLLKQRNSSNTDWNIIYSLDQNGSNTVYSTSPLGQVTPQFTGQLLYNSSEGKLYYATGLSNIDWQELLTAESNNKQKQSLQNNTFDLPNTGNNLKVLHKIDNNQWLVLTRNSRFTKNYIGMLFKRGVGESGQSNFDLIRQNNIYNILETYVYKSLSTATEIGTWGSFTVNYWDIPSLGATSQYNPVVAHSTSTNNNTIEQDIIVPSNSDGYINILLYGTSGSAEQVDIHINNTLIDSVSPVLTGGNDFLNYKYYTGQGTHTVKLTHKGTTGKSLYVCSLNASKLNNIYSELDFDTISYYRDSNYYSQTEGASEYAISDSDDLKFIGSYHGNEIAQATEKFYIDGIEQAINTGDNIICTDIQIKQHTLINSKITAKSTTIINGNGRIEKLINLDGNINTSEAYLGMGIAFHNFDTVSYPARLENITGDNTWYDLEHSNTVVQENNLTGQEIITVLPSFLESTSKLEVRSSHTALTTGAYKKLYSSYTKGKSITKLDNITYRTVQIFR